MHILITGGCGFVGSHIVNYLWDNSIATKITVLDKMTYASDDTYISDVPARLIIKDVNDVEAEDLAGVDLVIHAAAESHVDNSFKNLERLYITIFLFL